MTTASKGAATMYQQQHGPERHPGPAEESGGAAESGGPEESGGAAESGADAAARACDGRCAPCDGEPEQAPICFGQEGEGGGYFWQCRLCTIRHAGFGTTQDALTMLRAHCELRRVEHCVGAAVRRKRATGRPGDLTPAELTRALAQDPAAAFHRTA
ncbi:hypothetical protein [Streptomyces sp. NBC_00096]|uniref:hypothetical protein n=1 Tax=Streptomyces sp. NBC_00096 TaxID=2975650 RepID=UPI00324A98BE